MTPDGKPDSGGGTPRKVSWRGTTAKTSQAADWQRRPSHPKAKRSTAKPLKLLLLVGLLSVLMVIFICVLIFRPVQLPLLIAAVSDYRSESIPPNAWAHENAAALAERLSKGGCVRSTLVPANAWTSPDDAVVEICNWVQRTPGGGPGRHTMLIYLSAHGVVDESFEPCLLLPKSSPCGKTSGAGDGAWLRLRELVQKIDAAAAQDGPDGKHVVLLLDANQLGVNLATRTTACELQRKS